MSWDRFITGGEQDRKGKKEIVRQEGNRPRDRQSGTQRERLRARETREKESSSEEAHLTLALVL